MELVERERMVVADTVTTLYHSFCIMFILNPSYVFRTYKIDERGFETFRSWYVSKARVFLLQPLHKSQRPATLTCLACVNVSKCVSMPRERRQKPQGLFKGYCNF